MQDTWQTVIVMLLVLVAALYSLWYALPVRWRVRLGRFNTALGQSPQCSACSRCGNCGQAGEAQGLAPQRTATSQPIHFQRKP